MSRLVAIVTATAPAERDRSLDHVARGASLDELRAECASLDAFRRESTNLYERVRALLFLWALHRFWLPERAPARGRIPFDAALALFDRRFDEALDVLLERERADGPNAALSSALAAAYHGLGFQTLADQVRASVRSTEGNRWMFAVGRVADHPLRVRDELLGAGAPVLCERTPVRMDLTHSAWSDIFFLGMDFPEGAKVLNASIDLAVRGRDAAPRPPIETWLRVIDAPVLRLESVDLGARAEIAELGEVFDFARDHLGLLKAATIAAGLVPPSLEGTDASLAELLARTCGPGRGLALTTHVRGIPKGSRLAVSTNLLASLIALCMRATGQTHALDGTLREDERRLVAARAILGEWLGGSGGGWQDSGGLWPGFKLIEGERARAGDPEHGVSRGRLLPRHVALGEDRVPAAAREALTRSLVLVHGGMARDVGPILEMVTESYLLRSEPEWSARRDALSVLDDVLAALRAADVRALGAATTRNFFGPIRTIVPWASNAFTETLVERTRAAFGDAFLGFWMLGGMAGGGMGLWFEPRERERACAWLQSAMDALADELQDAVPFAMRPVVYDFAVNEHGTRAELCDAPPAVARAVASHERSSAAARLDALLAEHGFDRDAHEAIRADLRAGRIGLAQNRLAASARVDDVRPGDVFDATDARSLAQHRARGAEELREGRVAVVTLAGGTGSRWTRGAGVVKALDPFAKLAGAYRTFLDVHLAKSRRAAREHGAPLPHVVTTSYLTHAPIERAVAKLAYEGPLLLSRGRAVGLRLVPTERDLRFAWEELAQQKLDDRAQKVRESLNEALIAWAQHAGEASDYVDNEPLQCLHPVGHAYEVPNLLSSGTLARLFVERPSLRWLFVHNVDTLGADVDAALLGRHANSGACLTFEVVARRVEDRGGGLARVDGRPRLVESLAVPREEDEWRLSYYNTLSTWIDVDALLASMGLARADLGDAQRVRAAVRAFVARFPTYVTLKDVKKRWGLGQEDVFPLAQFERLWGDASALEGVSCAFAAVDRKRGQQLKEPAQLDGWLRDGSAAYVEQLGDWR